MGTYSYRNTFLTNIDGIPSTGSTYDLAIGQIGVFNARTYAASTAPSFTDAIVIAQGRDDASFPMGIGLTNVTPKTDPINASSIVNWEAKKASRPQNMIVTLGFDGVDTSKTLTWPEGKDMAVWITMSGQPIANLMANSNSTSYNTLTQMFVPVFPCVDGCTDNCGANVDCNTVADALIDEINKRKIIGGEYLSKYIRVSKLVSCDTPSGYPTVDCQKWTLEIADLGNQEALGLVQAQYPGVNVTRKSRNGVYSTYEMTLCDSSTPAAYNPTVTPVFPNCTDCPSGYTLNTTAIYAYTVTRTDTGGSSALTTFQSNYASSADEATAVRLAYALGTSTYQIYSDSATMSAATAGDVVTAIGSVESLCVFTGVASTVAWVEGDACTKAKQSYQISLKNDACGDGFLSALQAAYPDATVTQGDENTDNCTTIYYLEKESDNAACDTCNVRDYKFTAPDPFNGIKWTEVSTNHTGTGCVCGLKFESAYVQRDRAECYFDEVSYEVEPLFITVSTKNPSDLDPSSLCQDLPAVTVIQNVKYQSGLGASIVGDRVKASNFYFNRPWKNDPAERDAMHYELGVDLKGYYDEYILTYRTSLPGASGFSGFGSSQFQEFELHVYYPEGMGSDFVTAINSFVTFPGSVVKPIV